MFDGTHAQTSDQAPLATEAVQRVGAFVMLPTLIRQLGMDPIPALMEAGIEPTALQDAENRISHAALGRLLHDAALQTGCVHFGLLAGRTWHLSDFGVVGELMRNSPTVGEALRKLVSYQHLNSERAVAFVREAAGVVDLGCAIYGDGLTGVEQFCDTYLAAAVNFLRQLCGPGWNPTEVFLPHSGPADETQYRQYFRVRPHFDAEFCGIRFPASWMDHSIDGADPARLRAAEREARAMGRPHLLQEVTRSLRILLLSGNSSGDDVASMLSMHRRTLNRRLKGLGTTFQTILDRLRFEVACQLLASSEISLDEVAAALAYAGVSPFMRSFRRWAGTTPGRWRRMARRGALVGNGRSFNHDAWSRVSALSSSAPRSTHKTISVVPPVVSGIRPSATVPE